MSALLELAERVEAATGPDRELDMSILRGLGFRHRERQYSIGLTYGKDWDRYTASEWVRGDEILSDIPHYTSSIDAAMTLAPEGWRIAALCERKPWFCRLETLDFDSVTWGKGSDWITEVTAGQETTATAAAPALALCAAALRARASGETE